jgi:hypothetical protein
MFDDSPPRLRAHLVALTAALVVAVAVAVTGAIVAPTVADAAPSCPLSEMSSTSQPACWHSFTGAPFNTALASAPALAPDSAAVVSHMTAYDWSVGLPGGGFTMDAGSRPVYFAGPSDPTMKIVCTNALGAGSCTGVNRVNIAGQTINVPAGAQTENGSDGHLTVIETATGAEYDFWDTSISGSTIEAGTGSVVNVNTGNGLGAEGDAANFALTAGLLRPSELASGTINHALVVTVPCTNANGATVGYTYPATGGWGEACGDYWTESGSGAPMLGQLLRLNMTDAQIAASGAPVWQQTIMTALAHYGAYIEDTDGGWNSGIDIITQDSTSWTALGLPDQWAGLEQQYGDVGGTLSSSVPIPVSQLQVVSACVPEGTCPASVAAVPPAPAAPTAPPVAAPAPPASVAGGPGGSVPSTSLPNTQQKHTKRHAQKKHKQHKQHKQHKRHKRHHAHKTHKTHKTQTRHHAHQEHHRHRKHQAKRHQQRRNS